MLSDHKKCFMIGGLKMSEKINQFRKSKNLTIDDFAKKLGYSISAITKLIYGKREPSKNFFKKLKKEFPDTDLNIFFEK